VPTPRAVDMPPAPRASRITSDRISRIVPGFAPSSTAASRSRRTGQPGSRPHPEPGDESEPVVRPAEGRRPGPSAAEPVRRDHPDRSSGPPAVPDPATDRRPGAGRGRSDCGRRRPGPGAGRRRGTGDGNALRPCSGPP
jgi:hypothetical protein